MLGMGGGRTHTAVRDTMNLAARLEGEAPVGGGRSVPRPSRAF